MPKTWYACNTGNNQGCVGEEETGRTVAVTYDKEDAALVAAAPDLLASVQNVLDADGDLDEMGFNMFPAAIAKATGEG